jgi:hypothetical protein
VHNSNIVVFFLISKSLSYKRPSPLSVRAHIAGDVHPMNTHHTHFFPVTLFAYGAQLHHLSPCSLRCTSFDTFIRVFFCLTGEVRPRLKEGKTPCAPYRPAALSPSPCGHTPYAETLGRVLLSNGRAPWSPKMIRIIPLRYAVKSFLR